LIIDVDNDAAQNMLLNTKTSKEPLLSPTTGPVLQKREPHIKTFKIPEDGKEEMEFERVDSAP